MLPVVFNAERIVPEKSMHDTILPWGNGKNIKQGKHFSRYYEGIFILFNTGLRISEFVGLTTKNIDFKHHKIIVAHQLIRSSKMQYMIEEPKTESGVREIPMSEETATARSCFFEKG